MSWCQVCVGIHGEGSCPATVVDDDGRQLCVFHAEDPPLPCPIERRILAKAAAGTIASSRSAKFADKPVTCAPTTANAIRLAASLLQQKRARAIITSTATSETQEAMMATCTEPGCSAKLAHNNKTSKCKSHGGDGSHVNVKRSPATAASGGGNGAVHHAPPVHAKAAAAADHVAEPATSPASNGGNGHAGNGHDLALEERVSLVMTRIPLQDRLAFIDRWLRAEA